MKIGVTIGLGVDIVKVNRFSAIIGRGDAYVQRFTQRILHPSEYARFHASTSRAHHLAGSWAAKEAVFKTLDPLHQTSFQFKKWYRFYDATGKPYIRSDEYNGNDEEFMLSISHDDDVLVANVLRQKTVDTKL